MHNALIIGTGIAILFGLYQIANIVSFLEVIASELREIRILLAQKQANAPKEPPPVWQPR